MSGLSSIVGRELRRIWNTFSSLEANARLLILTNLFFAFPNAMVRQYRSLYMSQIGVSPSLIGTLDTFTLMITSILIIFAGYIADTRGRKVIFLFFDSFCIAAQVVEAIAGFFGNWWFFIFSALFLGFWGVGSAIYFVILQESVVPERRPQVYIAFTVLLTFPQLFMPYIGQQIIKNLGIIEGCRLMFVANAIGFTCQVIIRSRYLRETLKIDRTRRCIPKTRFSLNHFKHFFSENADALKWLIQNSRIILVWLFLLAIASMQSISINLTQRYTSLYIVQYLGLDISALAITSFVNTFFTLMMMVFVATPFFTKGKKNLKRSIEASSALAPLATCIFLLAKDLQGILLHYIIMVFGSSIYTPAANALWVNSIPRSKRGRVFALTQLLQSLLTIPIPLIGGWAYEYIDPKGPFIAMTVVQFLAIALISLAREPDVPED